MFESNYKRMKQLLFTILLFGSISLMAQHDSSPVITLGYHGDMIANPGVRIGYESAFKSWEKNQSSQVKFKSLRYSIDVRYYLNRKHHHGIIVAPGISYVRQRENGKFIQIKYAAGIHRSIVDGQVFAINDTTGKVEQGKKGQFSFYNDLSFLFGKQINNTIGYYGEIGINGRYPYNHSLLKGLHAGLGLKYSLNNKN